MPQIPAVGVLNETVFYCLSVAGEKIKRDGLCSLVWIIWTSLFLQDTLQNILHLGLKSCLNIRFNGRISIRNDWANSSHNLVLCTLMAVPKSTCCLHLYILVYIVYIPNLVTFIIIFTIHMYFNVIFILQPNLFTQTNKYFQRVSLSASFRTMHTFSFSVNYFIGISIGCLTTHRRIRKLHSA